MNAILQRFKSKTYWAAMIAAALTIIEANYSVLGAILPAKYQSFTPLVFPLLMMVMREVTTTALADK